MAQKFRDKTIRLVIVEATSSVRQLMVDVAKGIGFANAQGVSSLDDAKAILETESIDWLIAPLQADQQLTGMHFVRLSIEYPELKPLLVSFVVEEAETYCLSTAYELGLLNHFQKPITKDSFTREFQDLLTRFDQNEWNETLVSASYLRDILKQSKKHTDLLILERTLLEMYPGQVSLLINLARAQQLNGSTDEAKTALGQAKMLSPNAADDINQVASELFGSTDLTVSKDSKAAVNVLGIQTAIIIDSDDSERAKIKHILTEIGVAQVQDFQDGEAAWNYIDANPEPDLIMMEWRVPKLTGPLIVQRARGKGMVQIPIIVVSSLIKQADMPLVREMGVANIIQKPIDKDNFLKSLVWTIQQNRLPTDQYALEFKINGAIATKNFDEAKQLLARYLENPAFSLARKNIVTAEFELAKEHYEAARQMAIDALKQNPESIQALNILGKTLLYMRQFQPALKCFQKAQTLSPKNIERLCLIAETQADAGMVDQAMENIEKAKNLDPDNKAVQEGEVRVAISAGDEQKAKELMSKIESLSKVISYLNNKAVANSKCGHIDESINLYAKTLNAIPTEKNDVRIRVTYNLALAKVRDNKLAEALEDLKVVSQAPDPKLQPKAASLLKRIESALSQNTAVMLRESDGNQGQSEAADQTPASVQTSLDAMETMLEIRAGEKACYLIFKSSDPLHEKLEPLMKSPLTFKRRGGIERQETLTGNAGRPAA